MHKNIMSVIGVAVSVVILVIAYRIYDGSGGSAKVGDIEIKVDSQVSRTSDVPVSDSNQFKDKVVKQFIRSFNFKNHACDTNAKTSVQRCVDAGYKLSGMVGEVEFSSKDRCGSNFIGFEKIDELCGNINVHLQGCGYDAMNNCISHAFIKGNITLEGYKY